MRAFYFSLFLFLAVVQQAVAQQQYTINTIDKEHPLATNFLKMGTNQSPDGNVLSYNSSYLIRNGKPWFPVMGEMHFSRVAEADWEESILKMKAAGIQIISTYIFWNYTEPEEGQFDWSGNRNLRRFLELCKKHTMYVWLRPGPWVHAELRNGGLPDWLLAKSKSPRTNDPVYLHYAEQWFNAIGGQCKRMLFKDGGPVIGMQIENELAFKKPVVYEHMKKLKQMAANAGFDLPYYSAFAQGPDNQDEFLYMLGAYPDSPWSSDTKKQHKSTYFIRTLEADADIGADLFGKVDTKVRNTYPKLGAELGGGMQPTYHRRVDVSAKDIALNTFTKVASGINGVGYYMFHGGLDPVGKTPLQESRITGYPNDMQLINYDFEAPIGAMGIVSDSYNELRMLNLFLDDYGNQLAAEQPFFPAQKVKTFHSADTVQVSVRLKDNAGFIFLSNYQRFENLPAVNNFQLKLVSGSGTDVVPARPVSFPENGYAVWPYNLSLHGAVLHYATAQPLCIVNQSTYVFFTDGESEFVFQPGTFKHINAAANCKLNDNIVTVNRLENAAATFSVASVTGHINTVIVISRQQALQTTKLNISGKDVIVMTDGTVTTDGPTILLDKISTTGEATLKVIPHELNLLNKDAHMKQTGFDKVFTQYTITPAAALKGNIVMHGGSGAKDTVKAKLFQDSVLHSYAALAPKRFNPLQPGPLYQLKFHDLPGERVYKIDYQIKQNDIVKGWIANVHYAGDVVAVYNGDKLVYDQFNYNNSMKLKLNSLFDKSDGRFALQILPVNLKYNIYVEDGMRSKFKNEWPNPTLQQITLTPEYRYKLILH